MKILFIIHNISYCGAERVLALVANELCVRGNDVYILTNPKEVSYPIDKRINILDAYMFSPKHQTNNILGKIIRSISYSWGFSKTLKKYINEIRPDHIVSFLGFMIWQLLPYRNSYKITISDHSAMERNLGKKRNYERRVLPERFYCHTVLTQADKDYLGPKRTNVVVMNNPLTFAPISEEEYNDLFPIRRNILFCGSIERYKVKGLDNLIEVLAKVKKSQPDVILDIAGQGNKENERYIEDLASRNGVKDNIHLLGFQKDVASLMKTHKLLVVPSRSEGFGMVIIEAMASGCPVVSYSLTGPKEIITDNTDGILVDNQNKDKLSEAIVKLLINDNQRKAIGYAALSTANRFSLSVIVDKWINIFNK